MNLIACRDCGYLLDPKSRGCPKCALNLEAERMIDRFIRSVIVPGLIVVAIIAAAVLLYVTR
jgi:hypothetical protein